MGIIGRLENGKNLERTIEDMYVGETAYIHPDELCFDASKTPYLNLSAPIYKSSKSDEDDELLRIIRVGSNKSDYDINIKNIDYKWTKDNTNFDEEEMKENNYVKLYYNPQLKEQKSNSLKPYKLNTGKNSSLNSRIKEELEKELEIESDAQNYERCAEIRDRIRELDDKLQNNSQQ
jgi:hypothetical protein